MSRKLKILVSAYACSPDRGSEPGMGWNFVYGLNKHHEIHVIAEQKKWESPVRSFQRKYPEETDNLTFHFIEKKRNKPLRKIWPPSYYWYYNDWQKKAYKLALQLEEDEDFDIIHQLNMVGYREPGYLWKMDKPFVWGPIGGLENSPWRFLPSLGPKGFLFYTGRNIYNAMQRKFLKRPQKAARRKNARLIAATPSNRQWIQKLWGVDADIICEVGQEETADSIMLSEREKKEPLKIVWSGQHTSGKNLPLLFEALKQSDFPFELHILGNGEMTEKWKSKAAEADIQKQCRWYGWVEREEALEVMNDGHVFAITSISDLTSTVTLEALSYGLPVVCLNHCGFAHAVTRQCGIKVPVDTPEKAARYFAQAFKRLYDDEDRRQKLSKGAIERAKDFSWERKIKELNTIYGELLMENS